MEHLNTFAFLMLVQLSYIKTAVLVYSASSSKNSGATEDIRSFSFCSSFSEKFLYTFREEMLPLCTSVMISPTAFKKIVANSQSLGYCDSPMPEEG